MQETEFLSLIRLIQDPEQYHGKVVKVVGIARMKFEAKAVYVHKDDLQNAVTKNAIWIDTKLTDEMLALTEKYILVEGTFDKDKRGHGNLYSGSLKDIKRLIEWKSN